MDNKQKRRIGIRIQIATICLALVLTIWIGFRIYDANQGITVSISPIIGAVDLGDQFNNFGTAGNHSFSFWYKTSKDDNDPQMLFSNRDAANGYNGVMCVLQGNSDKNGALDCDVVSHDNPSNQSTMQTSEGHNVTKDGHWHYVVLRFGIDNSLPVLFFDGKIETERLDRGAGCASNCDADSASHTFLGIENNTHELTGSIGHFKVLYGAMTTSEIASVWRNGR